MSLIDTTYFSTPDCNLPQGTYNTIQVHLNRYERDILIQILGYDLYKLVAAYANPGSAQRIIDLVEGKEYAEGDYTVKWNGLINSDKVSILAYYAYIQYVRNYSQTFGNIGVVTPSAENAILPGPGQLLQTAGVRLRELIGYPGNELYQGTLYNFLLEYDTTYPEWIFTEYRPPNAFDL